jgi:hypothetical protein
MDTPQAHAVLVELVKSPNLIVRTSALDGMTWERAHFDVSLVLPFLAKGSHDWEVQCALWALTFKESAFKTLREYRETVAPFLRHEHVSVRQMAIYVLCHVRGSRRLILELWNDPSEMIRKEVQDCVDQWR